MKNLFIVKFIGSFHSLLGQEVGIINDPDGYTNIRIGAGNNFEIVDQTKEGDHFQFYRDNKSNWWKIETMPYFGEPITGYIDSKKLLEQKKSQ